MLSGGDGWVEFLLFAGYTVRFCGTLTNFMWALLVMSRSFPSLPLWFRHKAPWANQSCSLTQHTVLDSLPPVSTVLSCVPVVRCVFSVVSLMGGLCYRLWARRSVSCTIYRLLSVGPSDDPKSDCCSSSSIDVTAKIPSIDSRDTSFDCYKHYKPNHRTQKIV